MKNRLVFGVTCVLACSSVWAAGARSDGNRSAGEIIVLAQAIQDEPIFGSQLMTEQERVEYRARMRTAASNEERERLRAEHHEQMKQRAQARGVTLPDEPPVRAGPRSGAGPGSGMGPGPGMGGGAGPGPGPGSGMGPGPGMSGGPGPRR